MSEPGLDIPVYDKKTLHAEAALLHEWYLPHIVQIQPDKSAITAFHNCWETLLEHLLQCCTTSLVIRDFHSANIIWCKKQKTGHRIGLVHVHNAMRGPHLYDLVSLAQDQYVKIPETIEKSVISRYLSSREPDFDQKAFTEAYAIIGAQRASRIMGSLARINKLHVNNPEYIGYLPDITDYLLRNLEAPILQPLRACYQKMGIIPRDR